jgi:thiamine-phosphate diphosphorylase
MTQSWNYNSRLYAILDSRCFPSTDTLLTAMAELVAGGVTLVQYRNKSGNARFMLEQARKLRYQLSHPNAATEEALGWVTQHIDGLIKNPHFSQRRGEVGRLREPSIRLIMNDRADLALAADFDGIHVGQDDLSPESVRKIIGPDRWLGVSTHNPEQLREADLTSADYLAIGPVFATSSKEGPDPVVSLEGVRRARQLTRKPLVAIGGITRANAASVIEAGADSVAVISDLLPAPCKSAEEFFRILR